jgi:NTE family protein
MQTERGWNITTESCSFKASGLKQGRMPSGKNRFLAILTILLPLVFLNTGCSHYPLNSSLKQIDRQTGYRAKFRGVPGNSEALLFYLTFSGGGTRAAALAYGVLEELKDTLVDIDGKQRHLLDEVDVISAVSGGSFTAGYYGLFGERLFQDFEQKFLNKNIQGALTSRVLFDPLNWLRLASGTFSRSDAAAEYYDRYIFDRGTFGDMASRKGPLILINATDMITGTRVAFTQEGFDPICSDLSELPVARAAAASSAVPAVLTPITLRNYAGRCDYHPPEIVERVMKETDHSKRQYHLIDDMMVYLDSERTPYIHLVDGGVADNLGLRAILDRVHAYGNFSTMLERSKQRGVRKVVFLVVNAETEADDRWSRSAKAPPLEAAIESYSSVVVTRYNFETIMLLRESFDRWAGEVRSSRCGDQGNAPDAGACGDIQFYLIEIKFDNVRDETARRHFKKLPTSFKLDPREVDGLRAVARQLLKDSPEYQRLLKELR